MTHNNSESLLSGNVLENVYCDLHSTSSSLNNDCVRKPNGRETTAAEKQ